MEISRRFKQDSWLDAQKRTLFNQKLVDVGDDKAFLQ